MLCSRTGSEAEPKRKGNVSFKEQSVDKSSATDMDVQEDFEQLQLNAQNLDRPPTRKKIKRDKIQVLHCKNVAKMILGDVSYNGKRSTYKTGVVVRQMSTMGSHPYGWHASIHPQKDEQTRLVVCAWYIRQFSKH